MMCNQCRLRSRCSSEESCTRSCIAGSVSEMASLVVLQVLPSCVCAQFDRCLGYGLAWWSHLVGTRLWRVVMAVVFLQCKQVEGSILHDGCALGFRA